LYAKYAQERTWPVGRLKPNDLGLFDAQGNVFAWCQERYEEYPVGKGDGAVEDQERELVVRDTDSRLLRGGSFLYQASLLRSAFRNDNGPTNRHFNYGFRLARTLQLGSVTALPPTAEGGRK
jgi:formylglycine-generating enzyme required for sulfatase activity